MRLRLPHSLLPETVQTLFFVKVGTLRCCRLLRSQDWSTSNIKFSSFCWPSCIFRVPRGRLAGESRAGGGCFLGRHSQRASDACFKRNAICSRQRLTEGCYGVPGLLRGERKYVTLTLAPRLCSCIQGWLLTVRGLLVSPQA